MSRYIFGAEDGSDNDYNDTFLQMQWFARLGRASAYRLRERAGAAGFAEAWDIAIACGADLQFHTALDQAINGVTTVRVMRGGTVEVVNAPDRKVLNAALLPKMRLSAALSAQARAVKATRET